jgi:hypothetical protein
MPVSRAVGTHRRIAAEEDGASLLSTITTTDMPGSGAALSWADLVEYHHHCHQSGKHNDQNSTPACADPATLSKNNFE